MKIALVGAGRIGRMHAGLLRDTAGVSSVVLADIHAARAMEVARALDVDAAGSVEAAMERADALLIATSTDAHAALIRIGADRRLPVFCEKPIALELPASREAVAHARAAGVGLQVGFQRRFDPAYREARRLIETGEIGTVYAIRLTGHDPAPPHESYIPTSGGLLMDFSIHDFDLIRWLTGAEVEEVYADGAVRGFDMFGKYGDVDTAVATVRMSNGVMAVLTVARHNPLGYDIRTEIFGSRDSVSVGMGPQMPMRSLEPGVPAAPGPAWAFFQDRFRDAYTNELAAFVQVARGEAPSQCTGEDGIEALRASIAATRALKEHRPVRVEEIP